MFLTENLPTIILFVSYIFAMMVFLMLLLEKIVESLFNKLHFLFHFPLFSFPIPSLIFPLILLTPFLPLTPFFFSLICMNLLFLHPTPILALFQLLFLSLFLITTSIYFYPSLFSFYTYLRHFHPHLLNHLFTLTLLWIGFGYISILINTPND